MELGLQREWTINFFTWQRRPWNHELNVKVRSYWRGKLLFADITLRHRVWRINYSQELHPSNEAKSFNGSVTIRSNFSLEKTLAYIQCHTYQSYSATNVMTSDNNGTLMLTVTTIEGPGAARSSKTSYKTTSHFRQTIDSLGNGLKGRKDSTGSVWHRQDVTCSCCPSDEIDSTYHLQ